MAVAQAAFLHTVLSNAEPTFAAAALLFVAPAIAVWQEGAVLAVAAKDFVLSALPRLRYVRSGLRRGGDLRSSLLAGIVKLVKQTALGKAGADEVGDVFTSNL